MTLSRIVRNPMNGESRGFGFVDMKDDEGADEVRAAYLFTAPCSDQILHPKQLLISFSVQELFNVLKFLVFLEFSYLFT